MISRKKKLRLIQLSLLLLASILVFLTYTNRNTYDPTLIAISTIEKESAPGQKLEKDTNIFYNIEYSGIDLSGNRYILRSEEAVSKSLDQEVVDMKGVIANFYFKDGSILKVSSDFGVYNNKTLDMKFDGSIVAKYKNSSLHANSAQYLNSKGSLEISGDVNLEDSKGKLNADSLIFDLKKQSLEIESNNNNYINTLLKLNEKNF